MNIQLSNDLLSKSLAFASEPPISDTDVVADREPSIDLSNQTYDRARLILELLSDPDDNLFFHELSDRIRRENKAGLAVVEIISSSLRESVSILLEDTAVERVSELLRSAPSSAQVTELALEILATMPRQSLSRYAGRDEILSIAALLYLERVEQTLTFENRSRIYEIATTFSGGVGTLVGGVVSFDDLNSNKDGQRRDIAGAACVLLLSRFTTKDIIALQNESGRPLEELAIRFSNKFPTSPNLWISVMASADRGALTLLDNYQKDRLPNEKAIEITKSALSEVLSASLILFPTIQAVIKGINMPAQGLWQSAGVALATAGVGGLTRFMLVFLDELKKHKISREHKKQLAAAIDKIMEADSGYSQQPSAVTP